MNREVVGIRHYAELLRLRCFSRADVVMLTGSEPAADSLLTAYRRRGLIDLVRRGLWVVLSLEDGQPVASRYRIASAVGPDVCVSHHSAFEYHGMANQVFYETYVSSPRRFAPFEFDGVSYRYVAARLDVGVTRYPDGVRVTDVERTVLDSINDVDKVAGLEEVLACLDLVPVLDPSRLSSYLAGYGKQALYQKTGFLLGLRAAQLRLPESFFAECESRVGKSVRYLGDSTIYSSLGSSRHSIGSDESASALPARPNRVYNRRWRLVVPRNLEQGES